MTLSATPSVWYFLVTGAFGLLPVLLLWQAQTLLLDVLFSRSVGLVEVAGQISLLSIVALGLGLVSILVLLVSSVVPLPGILRAKRKWAPLVVLLVMEATIIVMAVLYHLRTAWLYSEYQKY